MVKNSLIITSTTRQELWDNPSLPGNTQVSTNTAIGMRMDANTTLTIKLPGTATPTPTPTQTATPSPSSQHRDAPHLMPRDVATIVI